MTTANTLFRCARVWQLNRSIQRLPSPIRRRHSSTDRRIIQGKQAPSGPILGFCLTPAAENDIVLLKQKSNDRAIPLLTKPLRPGNKIQTERASIAADDIIGKAVRDLVTTAKGIEYRIHDPSLGEYTDLSPRLVTPVSLVL